MLPEKTEITNMVFGYIDQFKFLFYPDQWSKVFSDYSRNEIFTLIYLYRYPHVNMSEIATYINVPLNTATGVVGRMEKKGLALRERDENDKRVVTICLTEIGEHIVKSELEELEALYQRVSEEMTEEEMQMAINMIDKVFRILKEDKNKENKQEKKKVKRITIE